MSLSARLGIRSRRSRLKHLLFASFSYLLIVTLVTHGGRLTGAEEKGKEEGGEAQTSRLSSSSSSYSSSFLPSRTLLESKVREEEEVKEEGEGKKEDKEERKPTEREEKKEKEEKDTHAHTKKKIKSEELLTKSTQTPNMVLAESTATSPGSTATSPGPTATSPGPTVTSPGSTTSSPESTETSPGSTEAWKWRVNCTPPAIEQFPEGFMTPYTRRHGGLVVHIIIVAYMFLGIAIICDEYFVPSLEMICDSLSLAEDVAGATFMAAGSSAPELATSVIAVFVAEDDIGISGVIGSAVFNIMFVISVCALFAGRVISLNWWPLIRDSTFYCLSICALLLTIYDEDVSWYESFFLLCLYCLYIFMMYHNTRLEAWANTLNVPFKTATREEKSSLFAVKPKPVTPANTEGGGEAGAEAGEGVVQVAEGGEEVPKQTQPTEVESAQTKSMAPEMRDEDYSPWAVPVGVFERVYWGVSLPLVALHHVTTPDCRRPRFRRCYLLTFVMSMVWIAAYSYFMVWMITVIGFTLGIRDTIMGLTLVAVGVSAPDALSSLCVAKQGFGDMAVSNAIGSNVFDILLCLGLPWFLKTAIVNPGSVVPVESRGLLYSTLSLFSTVIFLIVATHLNGWKLDKKYGVVLMVWYLIFMVLASLYEMNVFSDLNPPQCASSY